MFTLSLIYFVFVLSSGSDMKRNSIQDQKGPGGGEDIFTLLEFLKWIFYQTYLLTDDALEGLYFVT